MSPSQNAALLVLIALSIVLTARILYLTANTRVYLGYVYILLARVSSDASRLSAIPYIEHAVSMYRLHIIQIHTLIIISNTHATRDRVRV